MNNKILLTGLVLASLTTGTVFADGLMYGYNNTSNGNYGSVIGSNNVAEATATSSMTLGDGNTTKMPNSLTFGQGNTNNGENSFVGGDKAKAEGRDTFAFGSSAEALTEYTIAIGSQARTIGYNTLAIGNGATVSGPSSIAIGKTNNVTGENSVAIGANNGTIKGEQAVVVGYNNKMTTADQEQLIFGSNSVTSSQGSIVVGTHGQATAVDALALGNNTIADVQNGVAIGTNSVTEIQHGTSNIKDNTTDIRFSNSTYAGSNPDSVVSFGTNGRAGAGGVTQYTRQLQNVAAGRVSATSTDAINGSQLYDVALEAQKHNTVVDGVNTTVTSEDNNFGRKEYKVNVNKDLVDMNSASFGKVTDDVHSYIGKDKVHFFDGTTSTNTKVDANGIKLENTDNLDAAEYTMDGMTANSNGKSISFTINSISAGDQNINNVKTGVADTDAVNVKQLKDYVEANKTIVQAGDNIEVTEDNGTYTVSTSKDLSNLNSVNLTDGNNEVHHTVEGTNIVYRGDGSTNEYHTSYNYDGVHIKTVDGSGSPVGEVTLTDKGLNNGGNTITNVARGVNNTDAVNVSQLKEVKTDVADVKQNVATNAADIRTIEHTAADHEGRITVLESDTKNIKGQIGDLNNRITNVGRNALNQANHYTDLQVNKGVAKASALAGLQFLDYNPKDKWSFAASVGHYRNANAVAVGAAYQPNENTMIHGGITLDGEVAYNLGVSFKTGGQKQVTRQELQDQVRQLQSDNARMQEELNEIRSMLEKK